MLYKGSCVLKKDVFVLSIFLFVVLCNGSLFAPKKTVPFKSSSDSSIERLMLLEDLDEAVVKDVQRWSDGLLYLEQSFIEQFEKQAEQKKKQLFETVLSRPNRQCPYRYSLGKEVARCNQIANLLSNIKKYEQKVFSSLKQGGTFSKVFSVKERLRCQDCTDEQEDLLCDHCKKAQKRHLFFKEFLVRYLPERAVQHEDPQVLKKLLEADRQLQCALQSARSSMGHVLLMKAISAGRVENVERLLDAGADPLSTDFLAREPYTPYHYAVCSVRLPITPQLCHRRKTVYLKHAPVCGIAVFTDTRVN